MNTENRKEKRPLIMFVFFVFSFRLLMYFWYMKAPSQRFISDTIRKCILGDSTRIFSLIAVCVIICNLRRIPIRKDYLAMFCLFCYSMGESNALMASWIISSDFLTVFGFLLTGYYGALLIDSMHSKSWLSKRRASFAAFSGILFVVVCVFQWRCSVTAFIVCCIAKKVFFDSRKIQMKQGHKLAIGILRVLLITFLVSSLVHIILLISKLFHVALLINATLLDAFIEGIVIIIWNIKCVEIIRVDSGGS